VTVAAELEPEQRELLAEMVEAERDLPRDMRRWFLVRVLEGDLLEGPDRQRKVIAADLDELVYAGYLRVDTHGNYAISPEGRAFYASIQQQAGEPAQRADAEVRRYLDGEKFRSAYSGAYDLWVEAEDLLWRADSRRELTTVGHKAREAMQKFATEAVERYQPPDVTPNPVLVNRRLGAVIAAALPSLPKARGNVLKRLGDYSEALVDLVQRQEHGAQKEGEPLAWVDARRVVLHVAFVMFEFSAAFHDALGDSHTP
jgi:hypothetical protein